MGVENAGKSTGFIISAACLGDASAMSMGAYLWQKSGSLLATFCYSGAGCLAAALVLTRWALSYKVALRKGNSDYENFEENTKN